MENRLGLRRLLHKSTNKSKTNPPIAEQDVSARNKTNSAYVNQTTRLPDPSLAVNLTQDGKYWLRAAELLKKTKPEEYEKLQEAIQDFPGTSGTLEERIENILSAHLAKIMDRQWRIRVGARLSIPVRNLLESVVKTLMSFKDLGSAAAALDPVHAGLPWAGVCVLLPLVVNLSSQETAAKTGLDRISMVVARCSAIERVYSTSTDIRLAKETEALLIALYAKILEYQAVAACFLSKRTLIRYARAVPSLDNFVEILNEVQRSEDEFLKTFSVQQSARDEMYKQKIGEALRNVEQRLEDLRGVSDKGQQTLSWLSDIKFGSDHERARYALGSAYEKSGRWLLQGYLYSGWKQHHAYSPSTFWLRSSVGTGKTCLTSIVVQEHLQELGSSAQERLVYFYCSERANPPSTSLGVLRSILAQLAWDVSGTVLVKEVTSLYEDANKISGTGRPNINQCVDLISRLVTSLPKVTIIIDGLEECVDYWILLESLQKVSESSYEKPRFFFTSRMHVEVSSYFPLCVTSGTEGNSADIEKFIEIEMTAPKQRLLEGKYPELEQRLAKVLNERAEHMFRWVELELKLFLSPRYRKRYWKDVVVNLDDLESRASKGIPQLNETYDIIRQRNTEGQPYAKELADRTLKWLLLSVSTLDNRVWPQDALDMIAASSVVEAVSIDTDGKRDLSIDHDFIASVCSNLIVIDIVTKTFRFAHLSVVEYLQTITVEDIRPHEKEFSLSNVSTEIAISCLACIKHRTEISGKQLAGPQPRQRPTLGRSYTTVGPVPTLSTMPIDLLRFSVLYWPLFYLRSSQVGDRKEVLKALFHSIMLEECHSKAVIFWLEQYVYSSTLSFRSHVSGDTMRRWYEMWLDGWSPTQVVKAEGDERYVKRHPVQPLMFLDSDHLVPSRVFVAAVFGLDQVIEVAADKELTATNSLSLSSLQVAAAFGNVSTVQALLRRKPILHTVNLVSSKDRVFWDMDESNSLRRWSHGTALHFAFLKNEKPIDMVRAILQAGADGSLRNSEGLTVGDMALQAGWDLGAALSPGIRVGAQPAVDT